MAGMPKAVAPPSLLSSPILPPLGSLKQLSKVRFNLHCLTFWQSFTFSRPLLKPILDSWSYQCSPEAWGGGGLSPPGAGSLGWDFRPLVSY